MTTYHTSLGVVKSGSNTIGEITEFEYEEDAQMDEDTALADTSRSYLVGKKGWAGSLSARWDPDDAGQSDLTNGATVTIHYHPEGATSGDADVTGTALVQNLKVTNGESGPVMFECTLQGTGDITHGTVA